LFWHCVDPGVHAPHAPLVQTNWHALALPHWPFGPHVCTPLFEHCVDPGVHTPVHDPPAQTNWQAVAVPH
jgi:hypothetical protein